MTIIWRQGEELYELPTSTTNVIDFVSHNVEQTVHVGALLGQALRGGDVLCLSGHLGAGKTALTRGIASGWGAREPVTSPTFTLIHEHTRDCDSQRLFHIDSYRLRGAGDAWSIGLEDIIYGDDTTVIEWAENVRELLPDDCLWVKIALLDNGERKLKFSAEGERSQALLDAFRDRALGWC